MRYSRRVTGAFTVKINDFEGPLDLLLSFIEERKLLVNDVSLSNVADDFLAYLKNQETFPLGQAAHFVLVAATLLLLKSRSLLPMLLLTNEEEGDIKDLEFRLKLLQVFRGVAKSIGNGIGSPMFFGYGAKIIEPIFSPSNDLSIQNLIEAAHRTLHNAPQNTFTPEVSVRKIISLEDMINRLAERVQKAINLSFKEFAGEGKADKRELVVGFLAMLELVKRGIVAVSQESSFDDIKMNYQGTAQAPKF